MRGGNPLARRLASGASAVGRFFPAAHFPGAAPVPATPPRWFPAPTPPRAVDDSRSGACGCSVTSSTRPAPNLSPAGPEAHVARHRVPDCSAPRCSRNPGSTAQSCAGAGTCIRRTAGRARCATVSFPPKWTSPGALVRWAAGSSLRLFVRRTDKFKSLPPASLSPQRGEGLRVRGGTNQDGRSEIEACPASHLHLAIWACLPFPPLTPALSPLRGEGEAGAPSDEGQLCVRGDLVPKLP